MAFPTTSLAARYEAKDEAYANNDPATTITDQSGNARHATTPSAGGDPPTYITGVINGLAVYRFDVSGTPEKRNFEGVGFTGKSALTVSVLARRTAEGSTRNWPFGISNGVTHIFSPTESRSGAGSWGSFNRSSAGTVYVDGPTSDDTTGWAVLTLVWDGSTVTLYRNGDSIGTPASLSGTMDVVEINFGPPVGVNGAEGWTGDIALGAVWDAALDATARADLHTYVQDTYGITVSDYSGGGGNTGLVLTNYSDIQ